LWTFAVVKPSSFPYSSSNSKLVVFSSHPASYSALPSTTPAPPSSAAAPYIVFQSIQVVKVYPSCSFKTSSDNHYFLTFITPASPAGAATPSSVVVVTWILLWSALIQAIQSYSNYNSLCYTN